MTNRFRLSGTLARRVDELGVAPVTVLRRAGLPIGLFEQSRIWVTTEEMYALYDAIHEVGADPGIGLKLGSEERPEYYSPIAIAALYSRSFGEALKRIARYKRLTSPQEIRITEGRSPTECLKYTLSQPGMHVAICGAGTQGQMEDNIRTVQNFKTATPEEIADIRKRAIAGSGVYTGTTLEYWKKKA